MVEMIQFKRVFKRLGQQNVVHNIVEKNIKMFWKNHIVPKPHHQYSILDVSCFQKYIYLKKIWHFGENKL